MERPSTKRRRAATLAVLMTLTLGLGAIDAPVASAGDGYRAKLLRIVNRTRAKHDLRLLKLDRQLSRDAKRHTRRMIRKNRIFDPPNLAEILADYEWDDIGADVVGCGMTLKELHRILMTEDFHRTILLHTKVRRVGIGVIKTTERNRCGVGSFWATEILYG